MDSHIVQCIIQGAVYLVDMTYIQMWYFWYKQRKNCPIQALSTIHILMWSHIVLFVSCERFPVVVVDHEQVGKEDDGPGEEDEGEEKSHNLERGESESGF